MCGPASRRRSCCRMAFAYSLSIPVTRRRVCRSDESVGPVPRIFAAVRACPSTSSPEASPLWYCSIQSSSAVMFIRAVSMNCRSVAEQVCTVFGRARPLVASTSASRSAARTPAAVSPIRTPGLSASGGAPSSPRSGISALEEHEAAVRDRLPHADLLVDPDRHGVFRTHEQANRGNALEQEPTEVAHPALGVAAAPDARVDPDLLQLHGGRRPGGRLRLEEDRVVVAPDPRAPVFDLRAGAPAEALWVAFERVRPELLAMRLGAGRHE